MARPKGGPKYGGRKSGTPNKVSTNIKDLLGKTFDDYVVSGKFFDDLEALSPMERLNWTTKILGYIVPRLQTISAEFSEEKKTTIEEKLKMLAGEGHME